MQFMLFTDLVQLPSYVKGSELPLTPTQFSAGTGFVWFIGLWSQKVLG